MGFSFRSSSSVSQNVHIRDILHQAAILRFMHFFFFGLEYNTVAVLWVLCFCCKVWNICLLLCSVLFHTFRLVMKEIIVMHKIFQDQTHLSFWTFQKPCARNKYWHFLVTFSWTFDNLLEEKNRQFATTFSWTFNLLATKRSVYKNWYSYWKQFMVSLLLLAMNSVGVQFSTFIFWL